MTVQFSGTKLKSLAEVRETLKGIKDPDELERKFRALGTSGTAMVLGVPESQVVTDGFFLTADVFRKSATAKNN